jgi:hypothetical protein
MAAAQYSDYYYNNTYQHIHHHHQSQPQNFYGYAPGQYDCKNLNANDAYNNYNYNSPSDQWTQHYSAVAGSQHHQTQPHYHHQHLNMLNNQINDDYKNYSHHGYADIISPATAAAKSISSDQPNLNCNRYAAIERKNDLFYGQQPTAVLNEAIASSAATPYPSSQLVAASTRKRKIDNSDESSPALRALLTKPVKRAKCSPYFYHSQGSISPASSTDNYPQHYQLPSVPVVPVEEQLVNLDHYNQPSAAAKEGYEPSIDDNAPKTSAKPLDGKYCAASLFAPSDTANSPMSSFMESITTPPSSPKDVGKNDESSDNLWLDQNGGKFERRTHSQ